MKNCIFMYNPEAGLHNMKDHADEIKKILETKFDQVDIYGTTSKEDTIQKAHEFGSLYDTIVFSGGDGTFNDIINGVSTLEKRPKLGYISSGTANDIARNLKLPRNNYKKALEVILDGNTILHDVGTVNDRYFMYVVAAGRFSDISYRTKRTAKKKLGQMAYALDAIKSLVTPELVEGTIEIPGLNKIREFDIPVILIINSKSVGGITFNHHGHKNDGKYEILFAQGGKKKGWLNTCKYFIAGFFNVNIKKVIHHYFADEFTIHTNKDTAWCIDGDDGIYGDIHVKSYPKHIEIYVPKNYKL